MYEVMDDYIYYIFEDGNGYNIFYKDITDEWLSMSNKKVSEIKYARYVLKNGKRYYVNKTNKIVHKNKEVENAIWYVNLMGGKLVYLPTISQDGWISCADYKYYPSNSKKGYYLEEKEINGKSIATFYHALQNKDKQAEIFLIDCTDSSFTDKEIYDSINYVFKSMKTKFVKIIIVKNQDKLFGIFKKRE